MGQYKQLSILNILFLSLSLCTGSWASGGGRQEGTFSPGFCEFLLNVHIILIFNNKWLENYQNVLKDLKY